MATQNKYTGIILAGGRGVRLGRDKGLIEFHGKKLVGYAIDILTPFCKEIVISSNHPDYQKFPFRIVPDVITGQGPMMGIFSAMKVSSTTANLILAVDSIFITRAFYHYMLSKELSCHQIAVPFCGVQIF